MTRHLLAFAGLAASAAFFVSAAHAAPELPGFYWPGGARQDSTFNAPGTSINGMRIDAFGALIDKINSDLAEAEILAQAAIPKAQIDVANGVAGLDANGNVTANLLSVASTTQTVYTAPDGTLVTLPLSVLAGLSAMNFSPTVGAESVVMGGLPDAAGTVGHQALTLVGRPYSNYNAGCTLCVFSTADNIHEGGGMAGLSGMDPVGGAYSVSHGDMAAAGFYQYDEFSDARVLAQAASFTATTVTLATPMTIEQMAQLHPRMYIATNVVNTAVSATNANGTPQENTYWGYIKSWTANTITVYGWGVPNAGSLADGDGQIPDISKLDTTKATYTVPMVFIGIPAKIWSKNTVVHMDGNKIYGANATARANSYVREEEDFLAQNFTKPNSFTYQGPTVSYNCSNCDANAASPDSYGYLINGGGLPRAYVAQVRPHALEYAGFSTYIPGTGAPETKGTNHIMYDFASIVDTNNTLHFGAQSYKNSDTSNSYTNWEVRLGLNVDGTRTQDTLSGGTQFAQLAFNYNGAPGNLCILMGGTTPGLCQNGDGSLEAHTAMTFDSDLVANGRLNASLLTTGGANVDSTTGAATGNGTAYLWNKITPGQGDTEIVNINPSVVGGYSFYDTVSGNVPAASDLLFSVSKQKGFDATGNIRSDLNVYTGAGHGFDIVPADTSKPNIELTNSDGQTAIMTNYQGGALLQKLGDVSSDATRPLAAIKAGTYAVSTRMWCANCLNAGQAAGSGTGRWIFLDSAKTWRSDDGVVAAD